MTFTRAIFINILQRNNSTSKDFTKFTKYTFFSFFPLFTIARKLAMELTFEQLPIAVSLMAAKLDKIEQLLQQKTPPAEDKQEQLLNVDEACKLLNLAKPTVYGLVSQRKLPHMKQGKKLYFSKQELTEWVKAGRKAVKEDDHVIVDKAVNRARRK
jgi:excisionase family DNA binding protein